MTSSISWIDPGSLAETLRRVKRRQPAVKRPSERQLPFADRRKGAPDRRRGAPDRRRGAPDRRRAAPDRRQVAPDRRQAAPDRRSGVIDRREEATSITLVPPAQARRGIAQFTPPHDTVRARLEAFTGWLAEISGGSGIFVVDREGTSLINRRANPDLPAIAAGFMRLVERLNGRLRLHLGRSVTLELEGDLVTLIFVDTTIGDCVIGSVGERPLGRQSIRAAAEGLRRTLDPPQLHGSA